MQYFIYRTHVTHPRIHNVYVFLSIREYEYMCKSKPPGTHMHTHIFTHTRHTYEWVMAHIWMQAKCVPNSSTVAKVNPSHFKDLDGPIIRGESPPPQLLGTCVTLKRRPTMSKIYMYVCIYIYVYIYMYMHVFIYIYVYIVTDVKNPPPAAPGDTCNFEEAFDY